MSRLPLWPTLVVAAAVATMIALGFWQLERRAWKEALIARFERAETMSAAVEWPRDAAAREAAQFRHSRVLCERVLSQSASAGRNKAGETGWAQTARCRLDGGGEAEVLLGWSRDPTVRSWSGGEVLGFVAPGASGAVRLIAAPPPAGLAPLARSDPRDIPNNHLAYAVQWFFFAATALAIYLLALRKRQRP